jgi:hypothetical protein
MKGRIKKMKYTLSKFDFIDGMQSEPNNPFSYNGLEILWDYFEDYEENTGLEIEFDPVGIRCDFCEQTPEEIIKDYFISVENDITEEEKYAIILDFLREETTVLDITNKGTIVYINF